MVSRSECYTCGVGDCDDVATTNDTEGGRRERR
jgi:hypothetical protein